MVEGAANNAVTAVKLLRGSGRKMDPLSVLGIAAVAWMRGPSGLMSPPANFRLDLGWA